MESTPSSANSRFRFRDHSKEREDDESSEGRTSGESSSISSNEGVDSDLQSMTAKGVQHLCLELLELKQESDEDFQKNVFSSYPAFLAILKEVEFLQSELVGLKYQASSQKRLVQDFSDAIFFKVLSEETIETMLDPGPIDFGSSSPSILNTHTENILDMLDTLLYEHRLDDALVILDMEGEFFQNLQSGEQFSSDELRFYHAAIAEKKAILLEKFTSVAKHGRVSAQELHKALLGLCQLGESHLATQLLFRNYHFRIFSGVYKLQSSKEFLNVYYIQEVAKLFCSLISQAARSFEALNGGNLTLDSELTHWVNETIEAFASCCNNYIASISEISGKLLKAVDALQIGMSYVSLLETQGLFLQPFLIEHTRPCIEEVLRIHIDHLSEVINIFTLNDTWILGRYHVSGILTRRNYGIIEQQPEYIFLSNSGRKFLTVFQSVIEDVAPLIPIQMESSVLKGIMDLFLAYIVILENVLTDDKNIIQRKGVNINFLESPNKEVFCLANFSALMPFTLSIIQNIFEEFRHLEFEIDNYLAFIKDVHARIRTGFLEQFVKNIFAPNEEQECGSEIQIDWEDYLKTYDLAPSAPYLELYAGLKKVEMVAGDNYIDKNWLMDLLRELMNTVFAWIQKESKIWTVHKEDLADHRGEFMQFILDSQFLVEIARNGGYLSDYVVDASSDFISQLEASFISAGLKPLRGFNDAEWPSNAATAALMNLLEPESNKLVENENKNIVTSEESNEYKIEPGKDFQSEDSDSEVTITESSPCDQGVE